MFSDTAKQMRPGFRPNPSRVISQSGSGALHINQSFANRRTNVSMSRRRLSSRRDSKVLDKVSQAHRNMVFDEAGNDVTPRPMYQQEPGTIQLKQSKIFMAHDTSEVAMADFMSAMQHAMSPASAGPFTMSVFGSSLISGASPSTMQSENYEMKAIAAKQETLSRLSELKTQREEQKEEVDLDKPVDIYLNDTEVMCFLDIPAMSISVDSEEAEAVKKRNMAYTDICKNRQASDKYVDRAMQTINSDAKSKEVQSDRIIMVEKESMANNWDTYDMFVSISKAEELAENTGEEKPSIPDISSTHHLESNTGLHRSTSIISATSTVTSTSSSQRDSEASTVEMVDESDSKQILNSETFQQSLQVMEKMVLLNTYQHKLAAYKGLPILPDCVPHTDVEDSVDVQEDDSQGPALELLWSFSCELTKGHSVSSMAWNKTNPDILAVGYGQFDFKDQKSGLVCIWSLKNPTWPERILKCKTSVTSLDFSASSPSQLAVGLYDGTIAIYSVQSTKETLVCDSRDFAHKHTAPVWQVKWVDRIRGSSGEDKKETLFSVSADGRISEWFFHQGLECTDMMKLKRIRNEKTEQQWKQEHLLFYLVVGLCFDFHHEDSNMYLVGTETGHIHKCSCSYTEQFLETYTNHLGPVYKVKWSPFCPDVFLSCSADWTIQLWSHEQFTPVLSFTSIKKAVYDIMWSPRWATVFGVVNLDRVEIWDLGASILNPTLVSETIPGVKPTSLIFPMNTDCLLVGDSEGHVSVYKLKNFTAGEGTQVDTLKNIVSSTLATGKQG
ncbi:dynein axonemal intermediate chain 4 isoform X2 [Silurus meridionalis]|uniref:dynein axonemal intermediate chain 4 isoform X2 n=1 Tax=Silurus meridionalis TaxID=175797 RepID=UPI001EEC4646|nr:dynein axonemal intermediate chain 4 isoform X2 [Silurus meridionalis]